MTQYDGVCVCVCLCVTAIATRQYDRGFPLVHTFKGVFTSVPSPLMKYMNC